MPCTNCSGSNPQSFSASFFRNSPCLEGQDCCEPISSACVVYNGPNLPCSGVNSEDSLELAIQKMDEIFCQTGGSYSTYSYNCLPTWLGVNITTESQFVEAITRYACTLRTDFTTFTGSTFTAYQSSVNTRFNNIENPGIICTSASVTDTDSLISVLNKYCAKFSDIDDLLDISGVTWNACLTVVSPPSTPAAAFQLLADQICAINTGGSLPTFNNIGTCLPAPLTSSDSLVSTVNKIKTRLCDTPTWDATNVTWGCVGAPSSSSNIEEAVQNIVDQVNTLLQAMPTFDNGDFVVAATNPSDPCAGVTVSLATPINQDRFVAATAGDSSPGTLQAKIIQGSGITLDFSNPAQVTISASGTADSFEVKADATDNSPDFLIDKVNGSSSSGISINPAYNPTSKQVDFNLSTDLEALFDVLLDQLTPGSDLYAKFCEKVANCPSPCDAPTNVQAIPGSSPTTTTTTLLP